MPEPLDPVATMPDPINHIVWKPVDSLTANEYNPNVVFSPELRLLELSIVSSGWLQPIIVDTTGAIIDGFHRWAIAKKKGPVRERYGGLVPCAVLELDPKERRLMTVRMNRAKGTHVAVRMSDLVKELIDDLGATPEEIATGIGGSLREVDLLYQDSIFKTRNLDKAPFSKAWVPRETRADQSG